MQVTFDMYKQYTEGLNQRDDLIDFFSNLQSIEYLYLYEETAIFLARSIAPYSPCLNDEDLFIFYFCESEYWFDPDDQADLNLVRLDSPTVYLAFKITDDDADAIKRSDIPFISLLRDEMKYYYVEYEKPFFGNVKGLNVPSVLSVYTLEQNYSSQATKPKYLEYYWFREGVYLDPDRCNTTPIQPSYHRQAQ